MFTINNISKSYGKKTILKDISLSIEKGKAIGILGTNGSGKSTLLNEIAKKNSDNPTVRFGYLPQENPLMEELKPVDNIRIWCNLSKSEILSELNKPPLLDMGITDFLNISVGKMSGGMKKRVSLATALINKPDILLMDEPFAALDLIAKKDVIKYINTFRKNGGTLLIASHEEEIFDLCDKVYLLKNGTLIDTEDLKNKGISYIEMLRNENE